MKNKLPCFFIKHRTAFLLKTSKWNIYVKINRICCSFDVDIWRGGYCIFLSFLFVITFIRLTKFIKSIDFIRFILNVFWMYYEMCKNNYNLEVCLMRKSFKPFTANLHKKIGQNIDNNMHIRNNLLLNFICITEMLFKHIQIL